MENQITTETVENLSTKEDARKVADALGIKYSGNTGLDTLKSKILNVINAPAENATPDVPITGAIENNTDEAPSTLFDVEVGDEEPDPAGEEARIAESNRLAAEETARVQAEAAEQERKRVAEEQRLIKEAEAKEAAEAAERAEADAIVVAKLPPKAAKLSVAELLEMDAREESDPLVRRQIIRAKSLRLVRVKIQNLDPSEANVPGHIITVYNKYLGKVSKYIPNSSDEPYHIPMVIFNLLKEKKFVLRKELPGKFGIKKYKTVMVRKYAIEELEPISETELKALAQKQAAEGLIDE